MRANVVVAIAGLLAIAWIGAVAAGAASTWPRLPLDLPAGDPAVAVAYRRAVTEHVVRAATTALLPVLVLGLALWLRRRTRQRP
jgi:hypothetical protein